MATTLKALLTKGSGATRFMSAYVALVLLVAIAGPGMAVFGSEPETPVEETVVVAPAAEPEPAVEPEPVMEPAAIEPEPLEAPVADVKVAASVEVGPVALAVDETVTPPHKGWICVGGVKLDNDPRSGTYTAASSKSVVTPTTPSDFEIVITTHSTDLGMTFDFVSNYPVASLYVKGGTNSTLYSFNPPVMAGEGLHAPLNSRSGKYFDISHIIFCFGEIPEPETGSLVIHKYQDLDGIEGHSEGDLMFEDVEFTLLDEFGEEVDGGWTDEGGMLTFGPLLPGAYTAIETLPSGWLAGMEGLEQDVTIVAGETAHLWFGNVPEEAQPETGDVMIHKYNDLNKNMTHDEGEPLLGGWVFTISDGEADIASATTGSVAGEMFGKAAFTGLIPGTYTVKETLQAGWTSTTGVSKQVTVVAGQTQTLMFGNAEEFLPFTELDLAIAKVANKTTAKPGELISYTLTYRNLGELAAENFTIVDDFDERYVTVVDAAGGTVAGGKITWTLPGPLALADGAKTVTYSVRVIAEMPVGTTNVDNTVVISHPRDQNLTNNTSKARVTVTVAEEFLPFTGGEYLLLLVAAVMTAALGLLVRRREGAMP